MTDTIATRLLDELDLVGFNAEHDRTLQPSLIPVARKWIERWSELLGASPMSAVGPLASLLANAVHESRLALRSPPAPTAPGRGEAVSDEEDVCGTCIGMGFVRGKACPSCSAPSGERGSR